MLKIVLLFITAYLLGSIPSGLWIGQAFFNINIRDHGSGNTGTTNTTTPEKPAIEVPQRQRD